MGILTRIIYATVAVLVAGTIVVLPVEAQTPDVITAEVDRTALSTDDLLLLTVTVNHEGSPGQPVLPALDGLDVLGTGSSRQISIFNGVSSMSTAYRYQLRPTRTGELVIPPITVVVDGQTFSTQPLTVSVSQGSGQPSQGTSQGQLSGSSGSMPFDPWSFDPFTMDPWDLLNQLSSGSPLISPGALLGRSSQSLEPVDAPAELAGQDFYVEVVVDNPEPYQGQQVMYTVRLYQAVEAPGGIQFSPPSFTGFWSSQAPDQRQAITQAGGRNYRVTELQTVLFPTVVGSVTIEPVSFEIPGGRFNRGQVVQSQPMTLNIQPLPDVTPADFRGAVGRFIIRAEVDDRQVKVNDAVTLRVTLSGEGNLETLPEPIWPESSAWRAFDASSTTNTQFIDGAMQGERVFEQTLVPTQAGPATIPAIAYTYFDPGTASYETISSEPITLTVSTENSNTASLSLQPASDDGHGSPVANQPELRPVKQAGQSLVTGHVPLVERPAYWILWAVPLALLAAQAGWQRWQRQHVATAGLRRRRQAASTASRSLQEARQKGQQADRAKRILLGYIADKVNQPVHGLTQDGLRELLIEHGVSVSLSSQVLAYISHCDAAQYAPDNGGQEQMDVYRDAERLIEALDKVL